MARERKPLIPTEKQKDVALGLARGLLKGAAKTLGPEAAKKIHGAMISLGEFTGTSEPKKDEAAAPELPAQLPPEELADLQQLIDSSTTAELQDLADKTEDTAATTESTQSGEEPKEQ